VSLEGHLQLGLQVVHGQVAAVHVRSTRPDVAQRVLSGRTPAEVLAMVPLLFSVCGRSQAAVSRLAVAAAAGDPPSPQVLDECAAAVTAEMVREAAWRTLLDWPGRLAETPAETAVAAARQALRGGPATPADRSRDAGAISIAAFGLPAADFLALRSLAELDRWADAGATAAARFIRRVRDEDCTEPACVPLLEPRASAALPDADGATVETGALARLQDDALLAALTRRSGSRVTARFVARLIELAQLLSGRMTAAPGAQALADGAGVAWVENARGRLMHQAWLSPDGQRVDGYRIVAPTDLNFHPAGALAAALVQTPAVDRDALARRARRLVDSLDPCVVCEIGFDDA
jgi:coenzyme F420-reducing hydrogenase alpha subunit